jgi:predicted nucleotidyltransferase
LLEAQKLSILKKRQEGVVVVRDKVYTLDEIKALAAPVAQKYGIAALYLFGSYARGEASAKSDMDFRIDRGPVRSLFLLGGLYSDLEDLFGKHLDVVTTQSLPPTFLRHIAPEEVLIYEKS